jgi:hypothetical protein
VFWVCTSSSGNGNDVLVEDSCNAQAFSHAFMNSIYYLLKSQNDTMGTREQAACRWVLVRGEGSYT